jgi:glycosyltransferase involved in cell wall biosynthesis
MKIAILVPGFSRSAVDWCIPALRDHADRLAATGQEVHVFAIRWPRRQAEYAIGPVQVHAIGGGRGLGARVLGLWRRVSRAIAAEHRRSPFTVIHAFWADEPAWVAVWVGRRLGVPVVVSLAGGELVALRDIDYGLLRLPGRRRAVTWAVRRAAVVTAGSRYLLEQARPFLRPAEHARLVLAPLGVETTRFKPSGDSIGPDQRRPVVLNVGSMYPVKGQAGILRAFARVPDAELWIAGKGPLHGELRRLATRLGLRDRIRWLGTVPHERLPTVYRAATVFVQGSRHEAQGMALLEAAACGVPAVGTPVGVLPEVGTVARGESPLAHVIGQVVRDKEQRRQLSHRALRAARETYGAGAATDRFLGLYRRVSGDTAPVSDLSRCGASPGSG